MGGRRAALAQPPPQSSRGRRESHQFPSRPTGRHRHTTPGLPFRAAIGVEPPPQSGGGCFRYWSWPWIRTGGWWFR
jgi:hypothetical protein